jgi:hypothetical protein
MPEDPLPYPLSVRSSRARPDQPAPLAVLQQVSHCLHWGPEPRSFYEATVAALLAHQRCAFSDLTVAELVKLSESAASAYADALEKRLLK